MTPDECPAIYQSRQGAIPRRMPLKSFIGKTTEIIKMSCFNVVKTILVKKGICRPCDLKSGVCDCYDMCSRASLEYLEPVQLECKIRAHIKPQNTEQTLNQLEFSMRELPQQAYRC